MPGRLLASGRDADIFEYGDGLVLRRSRAGKSMVREARIMEYLYQDGFPVPAIEELSGDGLDLVMQRIDGVSMVEMLKRQPWTVRSQAATLANLHSRLHEIPAPSFLRPAPIGEGDRFLHMDLHPLNVMIGPKGPIVIDWPNAAAGQPAVDVAVAWILMSAGEIPGGGVVGKVLGTMRSLLVKSFVSGFDRDELKGIARDVVAWKVLDPHMSAKERAGMWRAVGRL
jgi:aminoglycoside phosphotransferase (APT) family kinase protein